MRFLLSFSFCVAFFFFVSCSDNDESMTDNEMEIPEGEPLEALILTDVSYGDHPQQTYDIYLPEGRSQTQTKTILLIHGGGWTEGDKEDMSDFVTLMQGTNPEYAIVNMNYVLAQAPTTPAFPNQFLDIQRVINQLKESQETLSFKAEFGVIGVSAGAHLGLVYDYSYDAEDLVKFVVDVVGPTDFDDPFFADNPLYDILLASLIDESAYEDTLDVIAAISPAQLVTEASSPTLLFYGNQDPLVPLTNGQRLEMVLVDNDIDHQFIVYEAGHGDFDQAAAIDISNRINTYIDLYLPVQN